MTRPSDAAVLAWTRLLRAHDAALGRVETALKEAGLVSREPCPEDGRGHIVAATEDGRALRSRMWPVYAQALEAALGARLGDAEAGVLADLLRRLL